MPLKTRVFLLFQMFLAMDVLTVESSRLRHCHRRSSKKPEGPARPELGEKNCQTSRARVQVRSMWSTSSSRGQNSQSTKMLRGAEAIPSYHALAAIASVLTRPEKGATSFFK
jgi:hypothetical protein